MNKVETKAEVRLDLKKAATWVPPAVLDALKRRESSRVSKELILVVVSSQHRTQAANLKDALGKVNNLVASAAAAAAPPKPPSQATVARVKKLQRLKNAKRLSNKKKSAEKKQMRSKPRLCD